MILPNSDVSSNSESFGLYDAKLTRLMVFLLKYLPTKLCVFLTSPITFLFYLFTKPQGHAVRENLRALFPEWGAFRCWVGGFRVFRQFALTYLDRLLFIHCGRDVEWNVHGMEYFEQLRKEPGGALVFTVHSGNYDIGSSLLAEKLGRKVHTVRAPERSHSLVKIRTIAVQGDRVVMDVSPLTVVHAGVNYTIPIGPLMLAETTRVPCYPILLSRLGVCRYCIESLKPFYDGETILNRMELAALWIPIMADYLSRNWKQWYVFEKMLEAAPHKNDTSV